MAANTRSPPRRSGDENGSTINIATTRTATQPFNASTRRTRIPAGFPRTRSAFVAPMFPLPTLRISMPFTRATRKPVGIEPNKYEATAMRA